MAETCLTSVTVPYKLKIRARTARRPSEYARPVFSITSDGMSVVIGDDKTEPLPVAHPPHLPATSKQQGPSVESFP
jgi:hypothetical protein